MPPDDGSSQRIAALEEALRRIAVQQAVLDERLLALERSIVFRIWNRIYRTAAGLYVRMGSGGRYGGVSDLRTPGDYSRFVASEEVPCASVSSHIRFSIAVEGNSEASLASLKAQSYSNWEMGTNGDYVISLGAGDSLSPHALHFYAQALAGASPALVYSDEDCINGAGHRSQPLFKPAWSPELFRSTSYIGRAVAWRRDVYGSGAAEWKDVVHVPQVLYHCATPPVIESKASAIEAPVNAKVSVIICSREVRRVRECVAALRSTSALPLEIIVVHHLDAGANSAAMRKTADACIEYRGTFDFSRMNNLGAEKATAPYLLFLNDDVIVTERGWDQAFAARLSQPDAGIAGAVLEYPDGTVQHAGVVMGMGDAAGHCGRFQMSSELWPWLRTSRDVSAVTGAMLGIRADLFRELRGFDSAFPVNYNDIDLCLRVREKNLRVMCLNVGKTIHRESQTRVGGTRYEEREVLYRRWAHVLSQPDPFYSRHLAPTERIALRTTSSSLEKLVATR
jgi:GT2 family glycosyltransferase